MSEVKDEPQTQEEIEAFVASKFKEGREVSGLYDLGVSFLVVGVVSNKLVFQWFRHMTPFNALLND